DGQERLLSYGTTAHPNILAGTVVLMYLWILAKNKNLYFKLLLLPVSILLFLTQSWSASIALAIGVLILYKPKIASVNILRTILWISLVIPFVIPFINLGDQQPSISRRVGLMDIALNMVESHPLIGVGLNNFTAVMEEYGSSQEFVRFIQPVHNSFWLYIAETGVVGIIFFWRLSKKYLRHCSLRPLALSLIPILSLDHYLTTNQTGILILVFFLAATTRKKAIHSRQE
ncbi:MAG: hypothetical protein QG639_1143, partial [Patescibacteria group bacterium]|nr:hypothetical protein [Patescibacteria group bacterium]